MKQSLYTLFDRIAGISGVIQLPNNAIANRYFKQMAKSNETIKNNAADFVGCKLGEIETETGEITADYQEIFDYYNYYTNGGDKNVTEN